MEAVGVVTILQSIYTPGCFQAAPLRDFIFVEDGMLRIFLAGSWSFADFPASIKVPANTVGGFFNVLYSSRISAASMDNDECNIISKLPICNHEGAVPLRVHYIYEEEWSSVSLY